MAYLAGIVIALLVSIAASLSGLDRDRAFYPTVLAVVASHYELFAVMGGSTTALLVESAVMLVFLGATFYGFRRNLWVVVVALAAHGMLDLVHADLIDNPGVPSWWPMFCMTYDVTAALYLAWCLGSNKPAIAAHRSREHTAE